MGEVSVSFDRAGQGWMNLAISIGDERIVLDWISYTTDVIGDVIRAALQIAAGGMGALARFDREPAEFRMLLERRWEGVPQREMFWIRVLELPEFYADAPAEAGEQRFCVNCDPSAFATAVHLAASRLLGEADAQGGLEWWGLPFPFRAFSALEAALAEDRPQAG